MVSGGRGVDDGVQHAWTGRMVVCGRARGCAHGGSGNEGLMIWGVKKGIAREAGMHSNVFAHIE